MRHSARRHGARTCVCGKISLFVFWAMVETRRPSNNEQCENCSRRFSRVHGRFYIASQRGSSEEAFSSRVRFTAAYLEHFFLDSVGTKREPSLVE